MINKEATLKHSGVSLLVTAAAGLLLGAPLPGAWTALVFYYSRELSQEQTKLAKEEGKYRSKVSHRKLLVYNWSKDGMAQFIIPGLAAFLLAILL